MPSTAGNQIQFEGKKRRKQKGKGKKIPMFRSQRKKKGGKKGMRERGKGGVKRPY